MSRPAVGSVSPPGATPASSAALFFCWSLTRLCDHLIDAGHVTTIGVETVRRILRERGVSWQNTKTWKASTAPDFTTKMHRILDLYDHTHPRFSQRSTWRGQHITPHIIRIQGETIT